jgi:hypothetical protein
MYDSVTDGQNSAAIPGPVSPWFATGILSLLQPEQRSLVDEPGMIRTQVGSKTYQKMAAVARDAFYGTDP